MSPGLLLLLLLAPPLPLLLVPILDFPPLPLLLLEGPEEGSATAARRRHPLVRRREPREQVARVTVVLLQLVQEQRPLVRELRERPRPQAQVQRADRRKASPRLARPRLVPAPHPPVAARRIAVPGYIVVVVAAAVVVGFGVGVVVEGSPVLMVVATPPVLSGVDSGSHGDAGLHCCIRSKQAGWSSFSFGAFP